MRIIAFVLALAATGCSSLAGKAADVVDRYCEEPQELRAVVRAQVNYALRNEGHSIRVTCAVDGVMQ